MSLLVNSFCRKAGNTTEFERTRMYLSETLGMAELSLARARSKLQDFVLSNPDFYTAEKQDLMKEEGLYNRGYSFQRKQISELLG